MRARAYETGPGFSIESLFAGEMIAVDKIGCDCLRSTNRTGREAVQRSLRASYDTRRWSVRRRRWRLTKGVQRREDLLLPRLSRSRGSPREASPRSIA